MLGLRTSQPYTWIQTKSGKQKCSIFQHVLNGLSCNPRQVRWEREREREAAEIT